MALRSCRLFLVDRFRRVEDERPFKASNVDEAKRIASEWRGSQPAELWNTYRRLARWD
jgi:hypothetical protein